MIMPLIGFVILIACIKLLEETNRPFLCAGIYTGVWALLGLFFGTPWLALLTSSAITFAYTAAYFWLLDRFEYSRALWWTILLIGLFLPVAVRIIGAAMSPNIGEVSMASL